ncbi:MAG: GFA family protein [Polyangiales bacterium]
MRERRPCEEERAHDQGSKHAHAAADCEGHAAISDKNDERISRCPKCRIAVCSNYGGGDKVRFVRVGTLDDPDRFPPDVHIFTMSKQPWVQLSSAPAFTEYLVRRRALFGGG